MKTNKKINYRPLPPEISIKRSVFLSAITGEEEDGIFANVDIAIQTKWMTHVITDDSIFEDNLIRLPLGGFFNHNSKDPNCKVIHTEKYVYLETIRNINKGEELTAKYTLYDPEK